MELEESQIRALQSLARGPEVSEAPGTPMERAGQALARIVPHAELYVVELTERGREAGLEVGKPVRQTFCRGANKGRHYLLEEPTTEGRALMLRLEAGRGPLSAAQRELLRLAGEWLPLWRRPAREHREELPPPVGSGVWVDAEGAVHAPDDVAQRILAEAGDLSAKFAELYRECYLSARGTFAERIVDQDDGCLRLRAEFVRGADRLCLVAIERLRAGSRAMFLARARGLSPREIQIAELVLEGWGNRGVGHKLGLKPPTINSYLIGVYKKLGVRNRTELTRYLSGASRTPLKLEEDEADEDEDEADEADEDEGDDEGEEEDEEEDEAYEDEGEPDAD